jgi:hypothetical protein
METKMIYVVSYNDVDDMESLTKEEFIKLAEENNGCYTVDEFIDALNNDEVDVYNVHIRRY